MKNHMYPFFLFNIPILFLLNFKRNNFVCTFQCKYFECNIALEFERKRINTLLCSQHTIFEFACSQCSHLWFIFHCIPLVAISKIYWNSQMEFLKVYFHPFALIIILTYCYLEFHKIKNKQKHYNLFLILNENASVV